jgi:hypothetical protein
MIGRYDLLVDINSHDFFHWLCPAVALGVTEVVLDISRGFRRSKWPPEQTWERYRTIVKPGAALAGIPCREGTDGVRIADYKIAYHIRFARKNKNPTLPRLRSPLPPKQVARYTVTLRQQPMVHLHRNSNVEAWMEFARKIDALVIPDYVVIPIDLHERLAIYAGAEMNFGVDNGPMSILSMTDYPMMAFKYRQNAGYLRKSGLNEPERFPWMRDNQFMFWEDDDLANIWQRFEEWKNGQSAMHYLPTLQSGDLPARGNI